MSKKDSFARFTRDLVNELKQLDARCLKPSKKLRLLTSITKSAAERLQRLEKCSLDYSMVLE